MTTATIEPAPTVTYRCPEWCSYHDDPAHDDWSVEKPHGRVVRWHESSAERNVYLCVPEFADAPGAMVHLSARLIDPPEDNLSADDCRRLAGPAHRVRRLHRGGVVSELGGDVLRTIREKHGLTQAQLAQRAGVSVSWLGRVERGATDMDRKSDRRPCVPCGEVGGYVPPAL